jgi:type I restriction enzyme S subunit
VSGLLNGWAQIPVGKFAAKTKNVDPSKSPAEVFELYSVPSFSTGSPEVVPGSEIKSSKQVVLPGDVLLCKIVPHINRVWTVKTQEQHRQIASGEWIVYRNHGCEPHYLRYCLSEESFREQFLSTVAGVGGSLMRARPSEVAKIEVLIPPLPEQRRIVAKLDSVTGHTARAQEQLGRIPRLIHKYREAILSAAFSGELTREWRHVNGFKVPPLSSLGGLVSDIRYGTSKKCHAGGSGIAVLRIPNVLVGKIDLSALKYASLEPKELNKLRLQDGDVLIVRSNGSPDLVGRPALVEHSAVGLAFAGYLIRLRPKPNAVQPKFLSAMLQSPQIRKVIDITARSTSGVHNINSAELGALAIPCPELIEQHEIVRRIETAFAWLDRVATEHANASRLLPKLDQAILAKAFRGELVLSDGQLRPLADAES